MPAVATTYNKLILCVLKIWHCFCPASKARFERIRCAWGTMSHPAGERGRVDDEALHIDRSPKAQSENEIFREHLIRHNQEGNRHHKPKQGKVSTEIRAL